MHKKHTTPTALAILAILGSVILLSGGCSSAGINSRITRNDTYQGVITIDRSKVDTSESLARATWALYQGTSDDRKIGVQYAKKLNFHKQKVHAEDLNRIAAVQYQLGLAEWDSELLNLARQNGDQAAEQLGSISYSFEATLARMAATRQGIAPPSYTPASQYTIAMALDSGSAQLPFSTLSWAAKPNGSPVTQADETQVQKAIFAFLGAYAKAANPQDGQRALATLFQVLETTREIQGIRVPIFDRIGKKTPTNTATAFLKELSPLS